MYVNETIQKHSKYKYTYYQNTHTLQNPHIHTPTHVAYVFWGAFAKLRKATISFVMSVSSPVRPSVHMEQLGSHLTDFNEIWYVSSFRKCVEKIQVSLKSDKNNGYFTWRPMYCTFVIVFRSVILRMRNVTDKVVEKIKTHILCSVTFLFKSCTLWDNVEKHCRAKQATDANMPHANCMLDT